MKHFSTETMQDPPQGLWNGVARRLHWLSAICMTGATAVAEPYGMLHPLLGWTAMAAIVHLMVARRGSYRRSPALWLMLGILTTLNFTGLLAPHSGLHQGVTSVALMLSAFYLATVSFEWAQRIGDREVVAHAPPTGQIQ